MLATVNAVMSTVWESVIDMVLYLVQVMLVVLNPTLPCYCSPLQVVSSLGPDVVYLPPENRAVLLAVAKRRGVLFNAVLMALLDDSWTLLDLAGGARGHADTGLQLSAAACEWEACACSAQGCWLLLVLAQHWAQH